MSARALVKKRTYAIGLFIPATPRAFSDPYYSELLRGLTEVSLDHGYVVSIIYSDSLDSLVRERIDGLVLTEVKVNDQYIQYFKQSNMPFVALGRGGDADLMDYVMSDTRRGLQEAVNHLYRLGHRRLGYVLGPLAYEYVYERYQVFRETQRHLGLEYRPQWVATGENSREGGASAVRRIIRADERPSAILASTDIMALGAIEYLREVGYAVPEDVSVVGFDDAEFSKYVRPSITTVRHDIYRAGRHAAQMLIAKLEGRPYTRPVNLPVRLIVRDSTAPVTHVEG